MTKLLTFFFLLLPYLAKSARPLEEKQRGKLYKLVLDSGNASKRVRGQLFRRFKLFNYSILILCRYQQIYGGDLEDFINNIESQVEYVTSRGGENRPGSGNWEGQVFPFY